ncbi:MAG: hypothetical protein FWD71_08440 [Oscillospiraceae bacterium]|nr:hypothetical protein [Oscillospiraceae bacterium]
MSSCFFNLITLVYFFRSAISQITIAETFDSSTSKKVNRNEIPKQQRIEEIVLNSPDPISRHEICSLLPDVSPTTVEKILGEMVKSERVVKNGKARNAKYIKKV